MLHKGFMWVLLVGLVAFLASSCDSGKITQLQNESVRLNALVTQKDAKIKTLTDQLQVKGKEFEGIKKDLDASKAVLESTTNELGSTKKELDTVKKSLDNVNKKLDALTAVTVPRQEIKSETKAETPKK